MSIFFPKPDKIVDQFINYITIYDLNGLKDYWNHFDQLVFERLDQHFMPGIHYHNKLI